ncbi:molybdopterin dinucleotide binding domain-containing protein [Agrobacterium sp. DKPNP3]|uniref:molybdopterin dinucleotide binding domain-containing protein n=1 Tax=Agrobacterium sp. DKPNP3 TaxID=3457323 RepID=UPI004043C776
MEPHEWLGAAKAAHFPFHLISNQPAGKLHSQYDNGSASRQLKSQGREQVRMHRQDAEAVDLVEGDVVKLFNERGACLAIVSIAADIVTGVIQMSTGAWFDPQTSAEGHSLEVHGNPNVLTQDVGTSKLAQGTSAHSCLVGIEKYPGVVPEITVFDQPEFSVRLL